MFSFKGFITSDKNTHLEHLEDDIINRGSEGGVNAINFLKSVRNMLAGSSSGRVNMSVKWDGAPAIICGTNPGVAPETTNIPPYGLTKVGSVGLADLMGPRYKLVLS